MGGAALPNIYIYIYTNISHIYIYMLHYIKHVKFYCITVDIGTYLHTHTGAETDTRTWRHTMMETDSMIMCVYIYKQINNHGYANCYAGICVYVHKSVCVHIYIYIHTYVCIYIYIYTHAYFDLFPYRSAQIYMRTYVHTGRHDA